MTLVVVCIMLCVPCSAEETMFYSLNGKQTRAMPHVKYQDVFCIVLMNKPRCILEHLFLSGQEKSHWKVFCGRIEKRNVPLKHNTSMGISWKRFDHPLFARRVTFVCRCVLNKMRRVWLVFCLKQELVRSQC